MPTAPQFAALDLGSNSFRLEIGQLEFGQITTVAYLKETVRLGAGLNEQGALDEASMQRGWDCLARFAEKIAQFESINIRAVATQTLREATNRDVFILKAEKILGAPINVIAGQEEARLVYAGVVHELPQTDQHRLVIDIGGRSTEIIRGHGTQADLTESFPIGSVSYSQRYFADGLTEKAFKRAITAAGAVFESRVDDYLALGWDLVLGSSGTVGAVASLLKDNQITDGVITRAGLDWLKQKCLDAKSFNNIQLEGLKEDRKPVLAGGVSILLGCFDSLNLTQLVPAEGALRTGLLYEMAGCDAGEVDIRTQTIKGLWQRFYCDVKQAERVTGLATELFLALMPNAPSADKDNVMWASQLHEIGRCISYTDYHRHGSYIVANIDAAGFTSTDQAYLSALILGQKGALKKVAPYLDHPLFSLQLLALRLSVIFCHARRVPDIGAYRIQVKQSEITLKLAHDWASKHPQSMFLLEEEVNFWKKQGRESLIIDVEKD